MSDGKRLHIFYDAIFEYSQGRYGYLFSCDTLEEIIGIYESTDNCDWDSGADAVILSVFIGHDGNLVETHWLDYKDCKYDGEFIWNEKAVDNG